MFRVSKVLAPLALFAGLVATTVVMAEGDGNQPPFGKGGFGKGGFGKGDDKKGDDKKGDKKADDKKSAAPGTPKADPQVEAWLAILLAKITDPHDTVRDSARGAVVAVGQPALPALQKLADGDDSAKAVAARKLITAIQGHSGTGPGAAPVPGGRGVGFGGFGFGGMSGPGAEPKGPGGWGGWGGWGGFGPPGMGPMGPGRGPKGGGGEEGIEVAPMPRNVGG
jgi:hypothetical protein